MTTSMELAKKVSDEVDGFLNILSRSHIIARSLDNYGYILVTDTMEKAVETANKHCARAFLRLSPPIPLRS